MKYIFSFLIFTAFCNLKADQVKIEISHEHAQKCIEAFIKTYKSLEPGQKQLFAKFVSQIAQNIANALISSHASYEETKEIIAKIDIEMGQIIENGDPENEDS